MIIDNIIIAHLNLDFCRFFVKFYESLRKIFQFIAKKAAAFGQEILSLKNGFLAGKIPRQKAIRTLLFCFVCSLLEQDMVLHHDLMADALSLIKCNAVLLREITHLLVGRRRLRAVGRNIVVYNPH